MWFCVRKSGGRRVRCVLRVSRAANKELTMRTFPMPLSGEKENGKNWTGGLHKLRKRGAEGLVIRQFFPRPILSWNSSWEFRFCQPNKPTNIVVYYTLGFSIWNDRRILFIHTAFLCSVLFDSYYVDHTEVFSGVNIYPKITISFSKMYNFPTQ